MTVAELVAVRRVELRDRPAPEPGPGEVQVRVRAVGICGSDLHNFVTGAIGDMPALFPMVLGHEPVGTVLKTGPGVTGYAPGDAVLIEPAVYCYHCEYCLAGRHNLCANLRFFSQPGEPGFLRELAVVPAANLLTKPVQLSDAHATLFEPLAVALHSLSLSRPQLGETAAVFGAGPIGLLTIGCLVLAGITRIFAVEPVPARRELARRIGATETIDPLQTDPAHALRSLTRGRGVDLVFECATRGDSLNQALASLRHGGRLVITGIPYEPSVSLNLHTARRREIQIFNVRRSNRETSVAIQLLCEHPRRFLPIVTHVRPLAEAQMAFEQLEAYADGVGKLVLCPA